MSEVISVEILNFLNFGDDDDEDEKRLVGLRQASGRRQKLMYWARDTAVHMVVRMLQAC